MNSFLQIHPEDNALVALQNLPKGKQIQFKNTSLELQNDIESKHKFVTSNLNIGDAVKMYDVLVGKATQFIPKGGLIGTHNLASGEYDTRAMILGQDDFIFWRRGISL